MQVQTMLRRFGRDVTVHPPQGNPSPAFQALIQPLRYKNKMYLYGVNTEIGFNSQGYYLYIGPTEQDLTESPDGLYLLANGTKFQVDRAEKVYLRNEPIYVWAILRTIVE